MRHIPLSYSRISDYETCPRKFHAKYISKTYPDDSNNPAFAKGNKIHKDLELCGLAIQKGQPIPDNISDEARNALPMLRSIISDFEVVLFEQQIAVDHNMRRTSWFDNSSTYQRVIVDLLAIRGTEALLVDWKSGKVRDYDDKETGQLHLSSAIVMALYRGVKRVRSVYVFVEHKQTIMRDFTADQTETLLTPFRRTYEVICSDTQWEPKKNTFCYNCKVIGCEFNGS